MLDCSGTFLFATLASCSVLVFAVTAQPAALVIAATLGSHAMNSHVSAIVLLPALIILPGLQGRVRTVLLAILCFAAAAWATSSQSAAENWDVVGTKPIVFWTAVLTAISIRMGPWYRRRREVTRMAIAGALLVLPCAMGVTYLLAIRHAVYARYFPPVIAPVAISLAAGLGLICQRWLPARAGYWGTFALPMAVGLLLLRFLPIVPASPSAYTALGNSDTLPSPSNALSGSLLALRSQH